MPGCATWIEIESRAAGRSSHPLPIVALHRCRTSHHPFCLIHSGSIASLVGRFNDPTKGYRHVAQSTGRDVIPRRELWRSGDGGAYPPSQIGVGEPVGCPSYHRYKAHGLTIDSQIACPELAPADTQMTSYAPVTIRTGTISRGSSSFRTGTSGCEVSPRRLHLQVAGVGGFLALAGSTVVVEPAPRGDANDIRAFLLGWILAAILHQRGVLVLHGSAVRTPVGAVVFVAESGVGKSTLAVAMHLHGYPLLTDDLCTVRCDPQRGLWVAPGLRRVKLQPETAARLGLDVTAGVPVSATHPKLSFYLADDRPPWVPLAAIYALEVGAVRCPRIVPLNVREAYRTLMMHTYRRIWVDRLGVQTQVLRNVAAIIERLPVSRFVRPDAGLDMDALVHSIEEDRRQ